MNMTRIWLKMVRNDIKSRYASSILGFVWAFILPLVTIAVFWIVYEVGFKNQPIENVPYILWFACGYVPWLLYSDFLIAGSNCFMEYSYLVKKIRFNIRMLPVIKMSTAVIVHCFFGIVLVCMLLMYHIPIKIYAIQLIYYMLALLVYTYGLVLIFSSINVFFRDLAQIVNIVIQIGFWITPIIWDLREIEEKLRRLICLNPMSYIVEGYRECFIYHQWFWQKSRETIIFWIMAILTVVIGQTIFKRMSPFFADEL